MALIKCGECNKEISDKASSCPYCGNPTQIRNAAPTLIELTSKKWKRVKLIAWVLVIISFFMFANGFNNGGFNNPLTGFGFSLGFIGVILWFIGKFGAWWHHR